MSNGPWTPEEDEVLAEHYPVHGPSWEGWAEALPHRSYYSRRSRAKILGLRKRTGSPRPWTPEEDEVLAEHYPVHGAAWKGWTEALPDHSRDSICDRAKRLGLRKDSGVTRPRPWTPEEDAALVELYPEHGAAWDGWDEALPDRSPDSRRNRMRRLLARTEAAPREVPEPEPVVASEPDAWTDGEVELLRCHYPRHGTLWDGWARQLPCHTTHEIERKARELGLVTDEWDEDEDMVLFELYPAHGPAWDGWAEALPGRSRSAIRSRASHEGLSYQPSSYESVSDGTWTELQMRILMRDLKRTSELCEHKVSECCQVALALIDTYKTIHKEES